MAHQSTDVGSRIQAAREQRGLSRQDISRITKLSAYTLKAIEQNEFGRLPGGMFRAAYVRMVAAAVGLDPEELVRAYRTTLEADAPAAPPPDADADRGRYRPALGWVSAALIAVTGVVTSPWLKSRDAGPQEHQLRKPAGAARREIAVRPIRADAAPAAAIASAVAAEGGASSIQLELRFSGPCWVSLVADGERLIYNLMQPGELTRVEARDAIMLRVGDAGAVDYSINGVAGRPLGGDGEAVTLRITGDTHDSL